MFDNEELGWFTEQSGGPSSRVLCSNTQFISLQTVTLNSNIHYSKCRH